MKDFRKALFFHVMDQHLKKNTLENGFIPPPWWLLPPFTMLVYLQSLQWCPVQIKKLGFTNDSLEKKGKYQIWILKRNCYLEYIFRSSQTYIYVAFPHTWQVFMHLQQLTLNICTLVTLHTP